MTMTLVDHAMAAVLAIVIPGYGRWSWIRMEGALRSGRGGARLSAYAGTLLMEWGLASALLVAWIALGRPLEAVGLAASLEPAFVVTLLGASAVGAALVLQVRGLSRLDAAGLDAVERRLASVRLLLPHTVGERDVFLALSVTAGFCEELLYRGFLMGYMSPVVGVAGATLAAALVFGLVHGYQGSGGMIKAAGLGLIMGVVYVVSGSIWPAVLLHAAVDIQGGLIGYRVLSRSPRAIAE